MKTKQNKPHNGEWGDIAIQSSSNGHSVKTSTFERLTLKYECIAVVASLRTLSREPKTLVLHLR